MDPNQPTNPPQQPQQPVTPPQLPEQVVGSPNMQPPAPQQPYSQPVYAGSPQQQPVPQNQYGNQYQPMSSGKSKRKLIVIAVVALFVIGVASFFLFGGAKQIVNKVAGLELENYSNSSLAFSMQVPKGWTPEERNEEFSKKVLFQEPVGDVKDQSEANKYYASMRVDYELADKDYLEKSEQEYFDGIKKGLQRAVSEKKEDRATSDYVPETLMIESEETTTVNGRKAYKVKLKVANFGGEKDVIGYEYGLFVFIDKKNQYEITLRAHESEDVNNKADSILTSFAKQ